MSKKLLELSRITQIGLEAHRRDPDCEDTWREYLRSKQERDAEWLRHTTR
jgi:hypothetical protein